MSLSATIISASRLRKRAGNKRARPMDLTDSAPLAQAALSPRPDNTWLEPMPDGRVLPTVDDPAEAGIPTMGSGAGAMLATAMRVVNAVPYVVDADPGLLRSLELPITVPAHAFRPAQGSA